MKKALKQSKNILNRTLPFFALCLVLLIVSSFPLAAEVTVNADGNTNVVINGMSETHEQAVAPSYNDLPLQNRISVHCERAGGDIMTYSNNLLRSYISQGDALIADIKAAPMPDKRRQLMLEKNAEKCQSQFLVEGKRRTVKDEKETILLQ